MNINAHEDNDQHLFGRNEVFCVLTEMVFFYDVIFQFLILDPRTKNILTLVHDKIHFKLIHLFCEQND